MKAVQLQRPRKGKEEKGGREQMAALRGEREGGDETAQRDLWNYTAKRDR